MYVLFKFRIHNQTVVQERLMSLASILSCKIPLSALYSVPPAETHAHAEHQMINPVLSCKSSEEIKHNFCSSYGQNWHTIPWLGKCAKCAAHKQPFASSFQHKMTGFCFAVRKFSSAEIIAQHTLHYSGKSSWKCCFIVPFSKQSPSLWSVWYTVW